MPIVSNVLSKTLMTNIVLVAALSSVLSACKIGQVSDGSRLRSEEGVATPFKLELSNGVLSHLQEKDVSFDDVKTIISAEEIVLANIEEKESYEIGSIKFDIQAKATKGEEKGVVCTGTKMVPDETSTVIKCLFKASTDPKTDPKEDKKDDGKTPPSTDKTDVEKACDSISVNGATFKKETGECICDADQKKKSKDKYYITETLGSECSYASAEKSKKSSGSSGTTPSSKACQCVQEGNKCHKKVDGVSKASLTIWKTVSNIPETCDSTGKGGYENLCNQPTLKCP